MFLCLLFKMFISIAKRIFSGYPSTSPVLDECSSNTKKLLLMLTKLFYTFIRNSKNSKILCLFRTLDKSGHKIRYGTENSSDLFHKVTLVGLKLT